MTDLAKLVVSLEAQTAKYTRELEKANNKLNRFEQRQRSALKKISRGFSVVTKAAGAFGVALGAVSLMRSGREALNYADNLSKLSDRLGISTEAMSALSFAAEQSGVSIRAMELGLQRMSRRVAEASVGLGEAKAALKELNLDAKELSNLPIEQQFAVIGEALSKLTKDADRTRLAFKLFDSEGVALLQTLKDGAGGIQDYMQKAKELGLIIDNETAASAAKANDAMNQLERSFGALSVKITRKFVPAITAATDGIRHFIGAVTTAEKIAKLRKELEALSHLDPNIGAPWKINMSVGERMEELANEIMDLAKSMDDSSSVFSDAAQSMIDEINDLHEVAVKPIPAPDLSTWYDLTYGEAFPELTIETALDRTMLDAGIRDIEADVMTKERTIDFYAVIHPPREDDFTLPLLKFESDDAFAELDKVKAELGMIDEYDPSAYGIDVAPAVRSFEILEETIEKVDQTAMDLGLTFASAFEEAIVSGNDLRDVFKGLLDDIIRIIARVTVTQPLSNWLTGLFSGGFSWGGLFGGSAPTGGGMGSVFGGRMASGGPVTAGTTYLVGEEGPELFVPRVSGSIIPNGAGGVTIQNTINVDSRADREQLRAELGQVVAASVESSVARVRQLSRRGQLL